MTRLRCTSKLWREIPAPPPPLYDLGNAYRTKGEMGDAEKCFRRAVDVDPEHARALAALGQILQKLARAEEAVPFLKRAIVLMPDDADLHCDLGNALQTLGQLTDASAAYRAIAPAQPEPVSCLVRCRLRAKLAEGIRGRDGVFPESVGDSSGLATGSTQSRTRFFSSWGRWRKRWICFARPPLEVIRHCRRRQLP